MTIMVVVITIIITTTTTTTTIIIMMVMMMTTMINDGDDYIKEIINLKAKIAMIITNIYCIWDKLIPNLTVPKYN